jgi:4,5-dihydroxyphthalate decarboxylase
MTGLPLRLAVTYSDRTEALVRGEVTVRGVELAATVATTGRLFSDLWRARQLDAAEMSLATYSIQFSRGIDDFIAIPAFPSRMFRHSSLYVPNDSGLDSLEQLAGKRVGVPDYGMTAAVWVRYVLQSEHRVRPADIAWTVGGLERPSAEERIKLPAPAGVTITRAGKRASLMELLAKDQLDAVLTPAAPDALRRGTVRRLLRSPKEAEQAWFRRTGLFPIMHTVIVRRELLEANEWLARELLSGFVRAKRLAWQRLRETDFLPYGLVWCVESELEQRALFGEEHWPYGVRRNQQVLGTFLATLADQGLTDRRLEVSELFAGTTLSLTEEELNDSS